jgi:hypothetical protein
MKISTGLDQDCQHPPLVQLKLKVNPAVGADFETSGETVFSKIAVPRNGDVIKIQYIPADPLQFVVMSE